MEGKTAILFGSTGLTGSFVLQELIKDVRYSRIILFLRKPLPELLPKITEVVMELTEHDDFEKFVFGDEIYCCLGTTIRKAGSQEAFRKVDFELPVRIAKAAKINGVSKMLVISSIGADPKSSNFYLRTKGEMESSILAAGLKNVYIFRPSILLGPRKESRLGESIGKMLMNAFSFFMAGTLKKYRPIHVQTVAKAMIATANSENPDTFFESNKIAVIGK